MITLSLTFSSVSVAYWEALLPTVAMGCDKPSEWETIECVKCVMEKGVLTYLTPRTHLLMRFVFESGYVLLGTSCLSSILKQSKNAVETIVLCQW